MSDAFDISQDEAWIANRIACDVVARFRDDERMTALDWSQEAKIIFACENFVIYYGTALGLCDLYTKELIGRWDDPGLIIGCPLRATALAHSVARGSAVDTLDDLEAYLPFREVNLDSSPAFCCGYESSAHSKDFVCSPTSTCPGTPSSGSLHEALGLSGPSQPRDKVGEKPRLGITIFEKKWAAYLLNSMCLEELFSRMIPVIGAGQLTEFVAGWFREDPA